MKRILASNIPPSLSHLDTKTINYLIDKYYENEITKEMLREYKINLNPSFIFKSFPSLILKSRKCPSCNSPLWVDLESKRSLKAGVKNKPYCSKCHNLKNAPEKEHDSISKNNPIHLLNEKDKANLENLNFNELFLLHVLLQNGFSKENRTYTLKTYIDYPIAPNKEYLAKVISHLLNKKILLNHEFSDCPNKQYIEESLFLENKRFEGSINLTFNINIANIEKSEVHNKILYLNLDQYSDYDSLLKIYKDLAMEECKEFIKYSFDTIKLPCAIGDENFGSLANYFLDYYSISQVFGLIDRCVCYISREVLAEKIPRPFASLYFLKVLQTHGGKSIEHKWNISKHKRPLELPQSQFTNSLYKLLNVENGFDSVVNFNLLNTTIKLNNNVIR